MIKKETITNKDGTITEIVTVEEDKNSEKEEKKK